MLKLLNGQTFPLISLGLFIGTACMSQRNATMKVTNGSHLDPDHITVINRDDRSTEQRQDTYIFKSAVQGDLACYVELMNIATQKVEHYDSEFEWCDKPDMIGQTIVATFHTIFIDHCGSIEPCGRSQKTVSLQKAQILE